MHHVHKPAPQDAQEQVAKRTAERAVAPPCPDPSAHHKSHSKNNALQNQASAAALYSTSPMRSTQRASINPLGPDGKLSSASAATSLKYAKAHELPSFPVVGIDAKSSAGAAALLANQNKKSPEWWKPEQSSAASKAALLAHDYKMAPLWQPEASAAGSKAALLAHKDGVKLNLWTPQASAAGNSAANIAMRKKGLSPETDYGYTDDGRKRALVAATGAHSTAGRKRANSTPAPPPLYPDSKNSARNALNAATIAHSPSMRKFQGPSVTDSNRLGSGAMEAARIQHAKSIPRNMYGSAPPVAPEIEEQRRNDALRASAIVMAKKIYEVQQKQADGASGRSAAHTGANAAHGQRAPAGEGDIKEQAMRYVGIQEAAQKLAQERLAKIGYDENAAYRSHYGYEKPRSKFSMRRGRNRAYSASETPAQNEYDSDSDEDDFRSRRIRSQMAQFNKQLADVDAKKRDQDRKGLMAAAERKVQAQMQGLDKKIFDETGRMSQSMSDEWDEKARKRAVANSENRMENHGKIHLGNGKWMDQAEIDAIAQARIQPTLDEITEKTDKRRGEDEKRRAAEEERKNQLAEKKRQERLEKERIAEIKAGEKNAKDEEKKATKARNAEEKATARQDKDVEKTKKSGDERHVKDLIRKSKEAPRDTPVRDTPSWATLDVGDRDATADQHDDLYEDPGHPQAVQKTVEHGSSDPISPTSQGSSKGFKSIMNKLKRRSKPPSADITDSTTSNNKTIDKDGPGFIGGAALRSSTTSQSQSTEADPQTPQASHDITTAQRPTNLGDIEPTFVPHVDRLSDVSSLSSDDEERGRLRATRVMSNDTVTSTEPDFEEARDHFDTDLAPPPTFTTDTDKARKGSPVRDSRFIEVGI
ncbi:hypothetical protein P153DRAFT_280341 [Dothidotthia symphoricarpi CBS 119687]|uniref:Eisosome protein 1 n=1 Tax=Dothidotthia symphoricarpi CBS 119687 TaxID=1392245 RepID=A0A6A6ASW6_9PLEO|nr:uncharacterized protein P153DRAFT_280341 [Dothidotthia symphoricarpi CBS 119687]KAF2134054.1 hypothetical protein P153DRAFT_280341 [Dothidotthia symphoricarpi CBS 119687]